MRGNYQLNPGADPTRASEQGFTHEDLVAHTNDSGAFTGAQRNVYSATAYPGFNKGQAASYPPEMPGVLVEEEFGHNTQATDVGNEKDKSLRHFLRSDSRAFGAVSRIVAGDYFNYDTTRASAQEALANPSTRPDVLWSTSQLDTQRTDRLTDSTLPLERKDSAPASERLTHLFQREWQGSELGMLGLGAYGVYSLLIRV